MNARPRLDQLLSHCGYCSRSEARAWVAGNRVTIDGANARSPDQRVDPLEVRVDEEPLDHPGHLTLLLHKQSGCVCSHDRTEGTTVYDSLPERWRHRNPALTSVGRLDRDTTGILLLTDDGPLVHRWTSPRHQVVKRYEVTVDGTLRAEWVSQFGAGTMCLEGESKPCRPAMLEILEPHRARLEVTEGRHHQVKRMFEAVGLQVVRLHRSRFGPLTADDLTPGSWRVLSEDEVQRVDRAQVREAG